MNLDSEVVQRLELVLSGVGIVIGFVFGFFLLFVKKDFAKANVFLAIYLLVFSARMLKSVFYHLVDVHPVVHAFFLGSLLLIGPSLWFYTKRLFNEVIDVKSYMAHCIAFVIFVLMVGFVLKNAHSPIYLVLFFHGIGYSCCLLYKVYNYKTTIQPKLKQWLYLLIGVTMALFLNFVLIFFEVVPFYPTSAFLFSVLTIQLLIVAIANFSVFKTMPKKYVSSGIEEKDAEKYFGILKQLMNVDKLYVDTELSLTKLSKQIGISSKQLSQVINQIEQKNYSQYITFYRVQEAKKLLKHPDYHQYKIAAIALESGFSSVSSFNTAFKKETGLTATQYKNTEK